MAFGIEMETTAEGNIDFEGMINRMRALDGREVDAGLFGGFAAQKAMWQEYGTSRGIPERPFLRNTLYEHEGRWSVFVGPKIAAILDGGNAEGMLDSLGSLMKNDIRGTIAAGGFAPLAAATVKQKGHSKPLIDTGEMFDSIEYKVR